MLNNSPVAAVLPVTDLKRAQKFYVERVGLKLKSTHPHGEVELEAGQGTTILLYERPAVKVEHTQAGFWVKDVEAEVKALQAKGIKFEEYDIPAMGLKTVNGVATMGSSKSAWFKDTEGNILAISQM